jgi:hypothetical protein
MAKSVTPNDNDVLFDNVKWAICSSYHTVLKTSPGAAIFGQESLTDCSNQCKNAQCIDYDYKVGDKVLVIKEGILCKAESNYGKEPWTITKFHTNGTIRIQYRIRMERLNIWRVMPFTDN